MLLRPDICAGLAFTVFLVYKYVKQQCSSLKLPPGPKGLPIIGNLLDIPKGYNPLKWARFKDLYGPITSLSAFGQCIVVLNDISVIFDLLGKNASICSNRPKNVFCNELVGWGPQITVLQYDDERFRKNRKYITQTIGSQDAVRRFDPILELETRRFLACILERPGELRRHVHTWAGASILKIAYGYNIRRNEEDPLTRNINQAVRNFSVAAEPGKWMVDLFPFLRHLPDWFPGTQFKRVARQMHNGVLDVVDRPFAFVKAQMANGVTSDSFVSEHLKKDLSAEEQSIVKWSGMAIFAGGSDTTVSVLYGFFLAMLHFPAVQRKAQAELDSVVGRDRLPRLDDRERLPYVDAVTREVLRWNTPVGLGIPHVSSKDSVFRGYFIPKGAVLIPNIWLINHDPEVHPDPFEFRPERFIGDNADAETDPLNTTFGFGRRECPGIKLAYSSLFIAIAMSLAAFDIRKARDVNGDEVLPPLEWTDDIVSHPLEFKCQLSPRSENAEKLIRSVHESHPLPPDDSDAEAYERMSRREC